MSRFPIAAAALTLATPALAETIPPITYEIVKSGPAAGGHPTRASAVEVRYAGTLADGTVFDSSDERKAGATAIFPLQRLIPGWITVLQLMRPGDVWTVHLPPPFAYGARGKDAVPPAATLTFRIELVDFADLPPQPFVPMGRLPGR